MHSRMMGVLDIKFTPKMVSLIYALTETYSISFLNCPLCFFLLENRDSHSSRMRFHCAKTNELECEWRSNWHAHRLNERVGLQLLFALRELQHRFGPSSVFLSSLPDVLGFLMLNPHLKVSPKSSKRS